MKNELEKIKQTYFNKDGSYGCTNKRSAHLLFKAIKNAIASDAPDFYFLSKNTCYIFEHFEFDASKMSVGKGSFFKRQEQEAYKQIDIQTKERLLNKKADQDKITNYGAFSTPIKSNYNKEFWKINFVETFNKHYKKIAEYKKNLLDKGIINNKTKIKNIFVIEDTTELGANRFDDVKNVYLPFEFDFCVDLLIKANKVDYFIFLNKDAGIIFVINKLALKNMREKSLKFDETEFLFFNNIQLVSALVTIPNNLVNNLK